MQVDTACANRVSALSATRVSTWRRKRDVEMLFVASESTGEWLPTNVTDAALLRPTVPVVAEAVFRPQDALAQVNLHVTRAAVQQPDRALDVLSH
jgi:hypothetical protein